jgi:tRNA-dihydrouridine synthase B
MPFQLGNLELTAPYFLSPLAGYTNLPFRRVIREVGGVGLCTTDLVNARSLLERNRKALKLIESSPEDRPLSIQLFGSIPEEMRDAALFVESLGVNSIDINMGCPVRKVCKVGGGSAMMMEHEKTAHLVKMMVDAVKVPVTCKMRLGWDDSNIGAPDLARVLEDVGVAAIFVHGRTREQGFAGKVNLAGIRAVVKAVKHAPVIGNGDVTSPQAAKVMFEQTGCAGVSVGRGAFYNPWIFLHINHYLKTGEVPPEPSFEERCRVMTRHLDLMIEVFGELSGCMMFRKVATWYSKRFGPANDFNRKIVNLSSKAHYLEILEDYTRWRSQFLDENQQLKPQYQPKPFEVQFDDREPSVVLRSEIPVPKGPVELW